GRGGQLQRRDRRRSGREDPAAGSATGEGRHALRLHRPARRGALRAHLHGGARGLTPPTTQGRRGGGGCPSPRGQVVAPMSRNASASSPSPASNHSSAGSVSSASASAASCSETWKLAILAERRCRIRMPKAPPS